MQPSKQLKKPSTPTEGDFMSLIGSLQKRGSMKAFALKFKYSLAYNRQKGVITFGPENE